MRNTIQRGLKTRSMIHWNNHAFLAITAREGCPTYLLFGHRMLAFQKPNCDLVSNGRGSFLLEEASVMEWILFV